MWFKQLQVFNVRGSIPRNSEDLEAQLEKVVFERCKAHTPFTAGWVAPLDEEDDEALVYSHKSYRLFSLKIEEKILPPYVIAQELQEKVKHIETSQERTVSHKEKYAIKDEIYRMLLPQAFSRISKIYAYFDLTNKRLMLNTVNAKRTELFLSMLHKSLEDIRIEPLSLKNLNTIMINWVQKENCPKPFEIEDTCLLQNPIAVSKTIRFKGSDLYAKSIKLFLTDGYKVEKITITWQDRITFVLKQNFNLSTIKYLEVISSEARDAAETEEERWIVNFIIMAGTLNLLIDNLLNIFEKK
jgi:recombination associated protein RdgC